MEKYLIIIIIGIVLYFVYKSCSIKEGFGDAVTMDAVDDNNAINILAKIAKDLQEGGGLKVKGNLIVDGNIRNSNPDIVKGPDPNRYIFHTPNDARKGMWIVPAKDDAASDWLWGAGLNLNRNGNHNLGGNLTTGNIASNVVTANDNISVNNGTNEGGRIRILNSLKNGKAGHTNDWSIWNMTGGYGNKLAFWRYNGDGTNPGPAMSINDNGLVEIPGNLVVRGSIADTVNVIYPVEWDMAKWTARMVAFFNRGEPDGTKREFLIVHPGAMDVNHPNRWVSYMVGIKLGIQVLFFVDSRHENFPDPAKNNSNNHNWRREIPA
jgi:hypothetical protein